MPYVHPEDVIAPAARWHHQDPPVILYDGGANSWSVAEGFYDQKLRLAIRWNGDLALDRGRRGFPVIRQPVWFMVPPELEDAMKQAVADLRGT